MPAYKDENTNKWFCKFYYTDWRGDKKQKKKSGFKTKKEALEVERNLNTYSHLYPNKHSQVADKL